jgi:hypothetical protein
MVQCSSFIGGRFQKFDRNAGPEFLVEEDLQLNLRLRLSCKSPMCSMRHWSLGTISSNGQLFSWGSTGCRLFNKAMSLLHLFLRGCMFHLHRNIVLHTPLSTMYHCRRVILKNFIFLDKYLYKITSLMKISFTLYLY